MGSLALLQKAAPLLAFQILFIVAAGVLFSRWRRRARPASSAGPATTAEGAGPGAASYREEMREPGKSSGESAAPAPQSATDLPPVVRAIWQSLQRGEAMLLPTAIIKESPAHQVLLALAAAHQGWTADGTRTPCLLGIEELALLHHRTEADVRRGRLGIHPDTADKRMNELRRGGYVQAVKATPCATNDRGEAFLTRLPSDPGQRAFSGAPPAIHERPERPLRRPRGSGQRPRSADLQSGEGLPLPGSADPQSALPRSADLDPPAPPVRRSVGSDLSPDLPTSTTSRPPDPGSGPLPQPEEAGKGRGRPPDELELLSGQVIAMPRCPEGCCWQCWTPHLERRDGWQTDRRTLPALGMHADKPQALDGVPITEKQLRNYCAGCLVRAVEGLRGQYGEDLAEVKAVPALIDRFLLDERSGRPWVIKPRRDSGPPPLYLQDPMKNKRAASGSAAPGPAPPTESEDREPPELAAPDPTPEAAALWEQAFPLVCQGQTEQIIDLWLRPLRCLALDGSTVRLWAISRFLADWAETHHGDRLRSALAAVLGGPVTLDWQHGDTSQKEGEHAEAAS